MPIEIPIKILTPIWTGNASGKPDGLKMSGIIGGLRQNFEMLVRKHGGHTCNITGPADQRCNYEQDRNICPACAVFGCTGWQRTFRLDLSLNNVPLHIPETDPNIPNRDHNGPRGTKYRYPCSIDTWLAGVLKLRDQNDHFPRRPQMGVASQQYLRNISVGFTASPIPLRLIPLRPASLDLESIVKYLLFFTSRYVGLGAKVRQGWGVFKLIGATNSSLSTEETRQIVMDGERAITNLITTYNQFAPAAGAPTLPNAIDCFCAEWNLPNPNLGLTWSNDILAQINSLTYRQVGFAMNYRLRRHVKFYEIDGGTGFPVNPAWRGLASSLTLPWSIVPWKSTLPFVRAVFGRDRADDNNKIAGLVGTSHLYQKNGTWRIRFFGRIPPTYFYRDTGATLSWSPNANAVRDFLINRMSDPDLLNCPPTNIYTGGTLP